MAVYTDIFDLAPQMRDYSNLVQTWKPYLMYTSANSISSTSVSTDAEGFRHSVFRDVSYSVRDRKNWEPKQVVLGGSTAFGIGASQNRFSLPSLLNQSSELPWFNLAHRAHNQFQEVITYLLFGPTGSARVVLFSGLNNLIVSLTGDRAGFDIPVLFNESTFMQGLNAPSVTAKTWIKNKLKSFWSEPHTQREPAASYSDKYSACIQVFDRCMSIWADLARARGLSVRFVLQPSPLFYPKGLSTEEKKLFSILDSLEQPVLKILQGKDGVAELIQNYRDQAKQICSKHGIEFLDLNSTPEFNTSEWIYVDRAHLTDLGYQKAANAIQARWKGSL